MSELSTLHLPDKLDNEELSGKKFGDLEKMLRNLASRTDEVQDYPEEVDLYVRDYGEIMYGKIFEMEIASGGDHLDVDFDRRVAYSIAMEDYHLLIFDDSLSRLFPDDVEELYF